MLKRNMVLIGVFPDHSEVDRTVEQLRAIGIPGERIQTIEKSKGLLSGLTTNKGGDEAASLEQDLLDQGVAPEEAHYYQQTYENGKSVVIVHPGEHWEEAEHVLQRNGAALGMAPNNGERAQDRGAVTPGMRGEDSHQTGVAIDAEGNKKPVDSAAVDSDMEHVEQIFKQKYHERNP